MRRVHDVLGLRLPGYDPGDSDIETRALRVLVAAGFPPPRQQYRIRLRTKVAAHRPRLPRAEDRDRARFLGFHGKENRTAFTVDRATSNDLLVIGWAPTRFTPDMSDEYFVDTIRRLWPDECSRPGAA